MRWRTLLMTLAALTAAAVAQARDPAVCAAIFRDYDQKAWAYRDTFFDEDSPIIPPEHGRPIRLLRANGCLTRPSDLDGMPALAARLAPYRIVSSGPAIRPTAVHLGIVTGIFDEGRATVFFRGLGYRSRGVGAAGLGRRLYIGPFTSQGALNQALATARAAGFISPYPALHTRF